MTDKQYVVMDATILSSLMSCARLTDFRFNLNVVPLGGKSNSLECGSIVHTFLEYYYKSLIAGKSKVDAVDIGFKAAKLYITGCPICMLLIAMPLCSNCNGAGKINPDSLDYEDIDGKNLCLICMGKGHISELPCKHKIGDFVGVVNTPKESGKFDLGHGKKDYIGWEWVLETCSQYIDFHKSDYWVPLAVEDVRGAIIYEDDELSVMWKAKFDLIVDTNQSILSIDHKTMKQRRDPISLNNQFMGQCVLMKSRNMIINTIGFQTSLKPAEKFERKMISYSADRLAEWVTEIVPYWAKVLVNYNETNNWPPNYTHCENKYGFCMYKEVCESDRGMRQEMFRLNFIKGKVWDITND